MAICEQGAFVHVYKREKIFLMAFSKDSTGVPHSGHGRFRKHMLADPDAAIGASVRLCVNDRKPGHYRPHMYKEREAYLAMRKAFVEDRGIESDAHFNANTDSFSIDLREGRIEYVVFYDDPRGRVYIALPCAATDEEIGAALRRTYEYLISQN